MINLSDEDLRSVFTGKIKLGPRNHYICRCPNCGKDGHFYINRATQLWDCKKCGEEGNIFKLLTIVDKLFLLGEFKSINIRKVEMKIGMKTVTEEEKKDIEAPKRLLPVGFKRIYEDDYLISRGFTDVDFIKYRIGYTKLFPKLKDYVVISIDEEGISKGYIGRFTKPILDKEQIRYRNSKNTNFSRLLFGYDEITDSTDTVIVVEGLFDKISLDKYLKLDNSESTKAVATFGKKISDVQITKLRLKGINNIILIYDYDAIREMKKYGSILKSNFSNVFLGFTMNKDINDSTERDVLKIFDSLKTVEQFNKQTVKTLR